jgi:hypothetical protein
MSQKVSKAWHARTGGILPVLAFALLLAPAAGAAQGRGDFRAAVQAGPPANIVAEPAPTPADKTVDRIVQQLEKKYQSKLVRKPEEREERGRRILLVRLLSDDDGKLRIVRVDAATGKELED